MLSSKVSNKSYAKVFYSRGGHKYSLLIGFVVIYGVIGQTARNVHQWENDFVDWLFFVVTHLVYKSAMTTSSTSTVESTNNVKLDYHFLNFRVTQSNYPGCRKFRQPISFRINGHLSYISTIFSFAICADCPLPGAHIKRSRSGIKIHWSIKAENGYEGF